jgi:hypothetical protein
MHRYMEGFSPPVGGKGGHEWREWPELVVQGRDLLEFYTKWVMQQSVLSEFDQMLVEANDLLQQRIEQAAVLALSRSCQQMIVTEQEERSMALRDVKENEMLLGFDGRIYFVHPLTLHYDVRVKDLGRWLRRLAKKHPTDPVLLPRVVGWYEEERPLSRGEKEWLLSYLLYPIRVMKILERYVLRKRHWTEEGYIQKLGKALAGAEWEMAAYRVVAAYFREEEVEASGAE